MNKNKEEWKPDEKQIKTIEESLREAIKKKKKGNGGRKVSPEKRRKQNWMWLEQVYYKLDAYEIRIKTLEDKVASLESLQGLPDEMKKHLQAHFAAMSNANHKEEKK